MVSTSVELFVEWAVGLAIIAIRLYARYTTGTDNFYWDDLCLGLVVIFWTFHTVFLYVLELVGSNIGLNEKTAMEVPDGDVSQLRLGSIYAFIAWLSYIFLVWSFKGVLMFLYNKLTIGLVRHRPVQAVGVFCVVTFLASLLFHLCSCHPVYKSWQIKPYPGDNCTLRPLNYIIIETLNIITDMGMMCIPLPLVLAAKITRLQKAALCILFSSGVFVMVAAVLRAYYSVTNLDTLNVALGWASREALVSVVVVSAPGIKPLLNKYGWFTFSNTNFSSRDGEAPYSLAYASRRTARFNMSGSKDGTFTSIGANHVDGSHNAVELGSGSRLKKNKASRVSWGESQECMVEDGSSPQDGAGGNWGIKVTTEFSLQREATQKKGSLSE